MKKGTAIERLKASRGYRERLRRESRELWRDTAYRSAEYRLHSADTLPPPEDVVEARRHRRARVVTGAQRAAILRKACFCLPFWWHPSMVSTASSSMCWRRADAA